MYGKRKQKSDIIITMSMFTFSNNEPVVVPAETTEEPVVEAVEDQEIFVEYEGVLEEDYTTAEEPDFGDDL